MSQPAVPFLTNWTDRETYAELRGNRSIHNFEGMLRGWGLSTGFEAQVGEKNLIDASLLELLATYRRAVCRISCSGVDFQGINGGWNGTGFLVGKNLLVTNNHVLNSEAVAANAIVDFEFERTPDELLKMISVPRGTRREVRLNPSRLFLTSSALNGLDYSFVWIDNDASREYGFIPMSRGSFMGRPHEPVFLIHHPNGDFKQASVDDTELLNIDGDLLLYAADTAGGSSGSPVFARSGKLIALHHAYSDDKALVRKHAKRVKTLQDGSAYSIANEGIKFSAIAVHLETELGNSNSAQSVVREVLAHFHDSDSVTGPFGAHGRRVESATNDRSRAIDGYNATNQDVDIAIWNMEWLNVHGNNKATLKRTATVFADITQDIWVLDAISRETANALAGELAKTFQQDYRLEFADDETHPAQPLTALFYNQASVHITRQQWPDKIEQLWRAKAQRDLHLKELSGPVFPSFPARFDVEVAGRNPAFHFNLAPFFVGNRGNAVLRRSVAARLMTEAVEIMADVNDNGFDWLIVGDHNTPMRRTRLEEVEKIGFKPILAHDRQRGGFTYLRSGGSILSQLFVPSGTERIGDDEGIVTVVERAFQGRFSGTVTGTAPYGIRISLLDEATAADIATAENILDGRAAPELPFESDPRDWDWRGLDKPRFMHANASRFSTLLREVNARLRSDHGRAVTPLTHTDLYVLIYCEAGLRNGVVDPNARHSLGERGLLPLPGNLDFWIGSGAPSHNERIPLSDNLTYYAHYLGQVKNRPVRNSAHGMLYRDLFTVDKIDGHRVRQAKLLAGIIHGYFLSGNYRSGNTPDFERLMQGYRSDERIDRMLAGSGYVHDGTTILANRQRNIDAAVADYAAGH